MTATRDLSHLTAIRLAKRDASPAAPGLGQRVRDRRVAAGLNHTTLAAEAGLSRQTVRLVERDGKAGAATLRKLATALRCAPADLDPTLTETPGGTP